MPELPEVETVRQGLLPVMEGKVIAETAVNFTGLRWPFPPRMAERLSGVRVLRLDFQTGGQNLNYVQVTKQRDLAGGFFAANIQCFMLLAHSSQGLQQ